MAYMGGQVVENVNNNLWFIVHTFPSCFSPFGRKGKTFGFK